MYIQGVSTRKVIAVLEKLCGLEVSSSQVRNASKLLDEELEKWCNRPIGRIEFLQVDARYEKVRQDGMVLSCVVLVATGVMEDGKRTVLGTSVSLSEAEIHWRNFFLDLSIEKYKTPASKLFTWLGTNISEGFTVFFFPENQRNCIYWGLV
jgi:transposase-like protein